MEYRALWVGDRAFLDRTLLWRESGAFLVEYRVLLDGILGSVGWNVGSFWMEYRALLVGYRALLDRMQGSFVWNLGLFW